MGKDHTLEFVYMTRWRVKASEPNSCFNGNGKYITKPVETVAILKKKIRPLIFD